MRKEREREK
jgi:hypothetical protein